MAHRASRKLLRDVSTPARSALRLPARTSLLAACRAASTYGREPPPNPQTPSEKMAQQALLSKLSTLSPDQISTLLSTQPGTPMPPGLGGAQDPAGSQGPDKDSAPSKNRFGIVLFSLVAVLGGFQLGEYVIDQTLGDILSDDESSRHDEISGQFAGFSPDEPVSGPQRAGIVTAAMNELPALHFLYPSRKLYQVDGTGNVWRFPDAVADAILKEVDGAEKELGSGRLVAMPETLQEAYRAPIIDAGPPPVCAVQPVITPAWAAADSITDPVIREKISNHLIGGVYNTPATLGMINHIVFDLNTEERHHLVSFGNRMVGWPGKVHGGALATVLVDSMQFEANAMAGGDEKAKSTSLDVSYINPLPPKTPVIVRVTMQDAHSVARQRWLESLEKMSPEARFVALTPPSDSDKPTEMLFAGLKEYKELVESGKEIRFVARMWRAEDNVPVCEAIGTFKLTPRGETAPTAAPV